jgi:chromosome segregation ATPase
MSRKRDSYLGTPQAKQYQHSLAAAHSEIERLRAAVRDQAGVELSEENDRLIDEIKRLRADNTEGDIDTALTWDELAAEIERLRMWGNESIRQLSGWQKRAEDAEVEIERLRAERDELRNTLNCIPNSILKAQAEIERLRSEKAELLKKRNSEEMQRMIYYWGRRAENAEDERAELLAALQEIEFHGGPAADYARAAIAKVEGK